MRLSSTTIASLPRQVSRFEYDRDAQAVGIVHFGIGAFHRAHQAWYTDRAMDAGDRGWAITGVSLRSPAVASRMLPQDCLYSVTERSSGAASARIVGSVRDVLVAEAEREALAARLAAPGTRIVSFTITEKGYCRATDGSLDHELAGTGTIYPLLAEGLCRRMAAGGTGLTLLSCDNLAANGGQLARLLGDYCERHDPALGRWIAAQCSFPATMVDRIVPATTPADLAGVERLIGLRDEAAVLTERFSQWVIEDRFAAGRPRWHEVGAQLVDDVASYETAKLRMLNGAHSALAYLGLGRGHRFVHEAIADAEILAIVRRIMFDEAAPSIEPGPGQDLAGYAETLLARFANADLRHQLRQIAMDGSQKIPQRWLETLAFHKARGNTCPGLLTAMGAWLAHLRGDPALVSDPFAEQARGLWQAAGEEKFAEAMFGAQGPFAASCPADAFDLRTITAALRQIGR